MAKCIQLSRLKSFTFCCIWMIKLLKINFEYYKNIWGNFSYLTFYIYVDSYLNCSSTKRHNFNCHPWSLSSISTYATYYLLYYQNIRFVFFLAYRKLINNVMKFRKLIKNRKEAQINATEKKNTQTVQEEEE